jgi:hypothetical protein
MAIRAPHLYHSLRLFCLGAFSELEIDISHGAEVPFAFEEHAAPGRPSLYEYRPLVRGFVEKRSQQLMELADAQAAIEDLRHEKAAAIFARAHAGEELPDQEALFMTVLLPVLISTAESCGGFDWHDDAFDRAYIELEGSLFGNERTYMAVAPLTGLSLGAQVELGDGIRVRLSPPGELSTYWPEANGILPREFGRRVDRMGVIELRRDLGADQIEAPDAPAELADAVTALRLATAGAIAAGPVLFERLDKRPYGIRSILPIAATEPYGEPTRLDQFRGKLAHDLRERIAQADRDRELAEALDRWELSLFAQEPFRSEQLRDASRRRFERASRVARAPARSGRRRAGRQGHERCDPAHAGRGADAWKPRPDDRSSRRVAARLASPSEPLDGDSGRCQLAHGERASFGTNQVQLRDTGGPTLTTWRKRVLSSPGLIASRRWRKHGRRPSSY